MSRQAELIDELAAPAPARRPVVLIVDDRAENLLTLEAVLEPLDLQIERATSGDGALRRLLATDADEVAVIVLDVQMPGMDGFETAGHIKARERTRHIPIIFLTAINTEISHALRGYETGAVDYVAKPFEPDVLRAKVAVLVELQQHARTIEKQQRQLTRRLAERDRAQAALARQTAELERSNAELQRFATLLSTELRGPIHLVAGFLDLLRDRCGPHLDEEGTALLAKATATTDRLDEAVEQLMAYATVTTEPHELAPTLLEEVMGEVIETMHSRLKACDATLTTDPLPEVVVDRWQLSRLFTQLIDNALSHSEPGVDIHVGLSRRDEEWVLSVRDDGPGLPDDIVPGLFTLLGRTDPAGPPRTRDQGVGLPIVRHIVERHGGTVWADSVPGQGTTISFTLPAMSATEEPG